MSAETELYDALTEAAPVAALVGARVYPDLVPQEQVLPAIGYARLTTEPITTIHSSAPVMERVTLEVACMASTRTGADALADVASVALGANGFRASDRRAEVDFEQQFAATVLTVIRLTTP
jgi:hypothetical protein